MRVAIVRVAIERVAIERVVIERIVIERIAIEWLAERVHQRLKRLVLVAWCVGAAEAMPFAMIADRK